MEYWRKVWTAPKLFRVILTGIVSGKFEIVQGVFRRMVVNRINKYYIKEMKMFYLFNKENPLEF